MLPNACCLNRKKSFRLFLLLLLLHNTSGAQMNAPDDNLIPPSPQAAALAKYAQVPVGLYTGVPQISIPLWELTERNVSVPVSLSYHASGNKVDELAGRTGLGWSMNAGGAITRVVRGQADEADLGFLYFSGLYTNTSMHTGTDQQKYQRYKQLAEGCLDSEPDMFSFNINGLTGTFAFNWDKSIMIASEQKVKIKCNFNGTGASSIGSWELTGPDGTVYLFQDAEITHNVPIINADEFNNVIKAPCIDRSVVTSWYITKITPLNNLGVINFTYRSFFEQYYLTNSEQLMHHDLCGSVYQNAGRKERKIEITGKDLVKIENSSGMKVEFIAVKPRADVPPLSSANPPTMPQGTSTFSLDTVVVKDNNTVVRMFAFEYDQSTGRLTLKKLRETGPSSTQQKPPYVFSYYAGQMPAINSYAQDHWGFYNAASNSTLIPPAQLHCLYSGNTLYYDGGNRNPNAEAMKTGVLTKIQYPAGGSSSFEYEPHDHSYTVTDIPKVTKQVDASASTSTDNFVTDSKTFTLSQTTTVEFHYTVGNAQGIPNNGDPTIVPSIELRKDNAPYYEYHGQPTDNTLGLDLPAGTYTLTAKVWKPYDFAFSTIKWEDPTSATPVPRIVTETAGGLRVRTITDMDGMAASPPVVRRFIYKMDDGSSSGYGQATKITYVYDYLFREDPNVYTAKQVTVRMASNAYMHGLTQGSTVGYRQVTTLYGDNGQNGKNVSKFVSPYDVADVVAAVPPFTPPVTYDYKRGSLLESADYKLVSGAYVMVKKIQNAYVEKEDGIDVSKVGLAVGGAEYNGGSLSEPTDVARYAPGGYRLVFGLKKASQTIETVYENNKSVARESTIAYDSQLQFVKSTVQKVSNGKELVTDYFYPQDFAFPSAPINELKNRHSFPLLEQITYERGTDGIKKPISGAYMEYTFFGQLLFPFRSYKLTAASPISNFATAATSAALNPAYIESKRFDNYDAQGNIIQVKAREKENETYLWGYNKTLMIARVQNAALNQVAYCDFEDADSGGFSFSTTSTNYSTDAKTGKRSYKGATITCSNIPQNTYKLSLWAKAAGGNATISVNGMNKTIGTDWTYCEWEIVDESSIILNMNQYYVAYTGSLSITTNGNLVDGIRLHPKSALMETYTYDPLIGITSVSAANNTITYYEYDGLGRLAAVRDDKRNILKSYQYQFANQ